MTYRVGQRGGWDRGRKGRGGNGGIHRYICGMLCRLIKVSLCATVAMTM